jgi:hypothetical protein
MGEGFVKPKSDVLQGTLALLVLKHTLHSQGPTGVQNSPILGLLRESQCYKGNQITGT